MAFLNWVETMNLWILSPNRFNGIYGAAIASKSVGDDEKATAYFKMLLTLTKLSASNRPVLEEAKKYVRQQES